MKDVKSLSGLMRATVSWTRVAPGRWRTTVEGEECSLTMNDFPEEPLYTIRAFGETLDIDDAPAGWTIEMPDVPLFRP